MVGLAHPPPGDRLDMGGEHIEPSGVGGVDSGLLLGPQLLRHCHVVARFLDLDVDRAGDRPPPGWRARESPRAGREQCCASCSNRAIRPSTRRMIAMLLSIALHRGGEIVRFMLSPAVGVCRHRHRLAGSSGLARSSRSCSRVGTTVSSTTSLVIHHLLLPEAGNRNVVEMDAVGRDTSLLFKPRSVAEQRLLGGDRVVERLDCGRIGQPLGDAARCAPQDRRSAAGAGCLSAGSELSSSWKRAALRLIAGWNEATDRPVGGKTGRARRTAATRRRRTRTAPRTKAPAIAA